MWAVYVAAAKVLMDTETRAADDAGKSEVGAPFEKPKGKQKRTNSGLYNPARVEWPMSWDHIVTPGETEYHNETREAGFVGGIKCEAFDASGSMSIAAGQQCCESDSDEKCGQQVEAAAATTDGRGVEQARDIERGKRVGNDEAEGYKQ